jgi:hypothetical protein
MLTYNTQLPFEQPISDIRQGMEAMKPRSPYTQFGQNHQDVLNYVGSMNADAYGRAAENVNNQYAAQQRAAQQGLALAGLQQMAQAQQQQQDLSNSRLSQMTGFANSLLGGLFS